MEIYNEIAIGLLQGIIISFLTLAASTKEEIYSTFNQFPKKVLDEVLEDLISSEDIVFSNGQYSRNDFTNN